MFTLIASLAATAYILSVVVFGALTALAFNKQISQQFLEGSAYLRRFLITSDLLASTLSELPLHLILVKIVFMQLTQLFGGFGYTLAWLLKPVDMVSMVALALLFVESWREDAVVEEAIKDLAGGDPADTVDSILSMSSLKRIANPIWTPRDIVLYPDIGYATNEEMAEAIALTNDYDQPRKMALDIYKWTKAPKASGLRPVLVHVHGGAWQVGSKNFLYPHEKTLLTEENWIVVNIGYRLAPKNAYPTHLIDVKRALRYIKRCISVFGGDPNFIVLSGDSAGGHLAAMAALTANDPQYQPGFEDVDTSVKGVITINGVLDVHNDRSRGEYFSRRVALKDTIDTDFLSKHSPIDLLDKAKQTGNLVPFLVVTGNRDAVVDCTIGTRFKSAYDQVLGEKAISSPCTLVQLPAAHHICHVSWSPRAIYITRLTQIWCQQVYNKSK